MNVQSVIKSVQGERESSSGNSRTWGMVLYVVFVIAIVIKVLWGYWERDLVFGDTSNYFVLAVRWHLDNKVNIVWSPLYTAYFGSWLGASENANIATFLHRVGLIIISTGLVGWLAFVTLPRVLAVLLLVWWIALPIHYDTLYEVHLFGALPLLAMAVISFVVSDKWREPILLSIALITTFLIRNEYILVVVVFVAFSVFNFFRKKENTGWFEVITLAGRYTLTLFAASVMIGYFYSVSYVRGSDIEKWSAPKHTLNMCQVYAFGYQQRHSYWKGSPWTGCSDLMQEKFGSNMPTLAEMITANPSEVMEHFLWNLSLTKAGLEVLLFNATSSHSNPDYAPVFVLPVIPTLLLGITLMVCLVGAILLIRKSSASPANHADIHKKLMKVSPLLLAVVAMAIAVILTQRPRPSYLLGAGVLYMWVVMVMISVVMAQNKKLDNFWVMSVFMAALLWIVPSYKSLALPSKNGILGDIYNGIRSQAPTLCNTGGRLAINEYGVTLGNYLCSPYYPDSIRIGYRIVNISSLSEDHLSSPDKLVDGLELLDAGALIIDPYMPLKYPGLRGCSELRDAFLRQGWQQLAYSVQSNDRCIAAYAK